MKKNMFFLILLSSLFLVSCEDSSTVTINGTLTNTDLNGRKLYLHAMPIDSLMAKGPVLTDSAEVKDGKFTFKTTLTDSPLLGVLGANKNLKTPDNKSLVDMFIVLEAGVVNLSVDDKRVTIGGTATNDSLNAVFYTSMNKLLDINDEVEKAQEVTAVPLDENGDDVAKRMKKMSRDFKKGVFRFVKSNIANGVGEAMFLTMGNSLGKEQLSELIVLSDTTFQNRAVIKQMKEMIDLQNERDAEFVGKPIEDLKLTAVKGAQELLSNHVGRGKYVYLYFWNTQSEECFNLLASLMDVHEAYGSKGFLLVGVSLDRDKDVWKQAMGMFNLPGVQLHDGAFSSPSVYGFDVVPHALFIAPDGKVLAINLSPDELEDKLEEVLK